jgi:hypothetical protein
MHLWWLWKKNEFEKKNTSIFSPILWAGGDESNNVGFPRKKPILLTKNIASSQQSRLFDLLGFVITFFSQG